jgi:hypothetical protein
MKFSRFDRKEIPAHLKNTVACFASSLTPGKNPGMPVLNHITGVCR